MLNKSNFSTRLEFIINHYEISSTFFADKIGVQRSSISHLLSGRNNPSLDFIIKILDKFPELNFNWLVRGTGEPFSTIDNTEKKMNPFAPTLFDSIIEEPANKDIPIKPVIKEQVEQNILPTDKKKPIDKVLVLYKDGSFDSYS